MDLVTQAALGAAVGEATLGRKVGNKAVLWGTVAGLIPDGDVLVGKLYDPVTANLIHRGFSHSILFAVLGGLLLGWLVNRLPGHGRVDWRGWALLFFLGLLTHPLLDCFTTWGTQLFWPLKERISLQSIFVIDPLYTLPLLITIIWLLFLRRDSRKRRHLVWWGLGLSTGYLLFTFVNKQFINEIFEESLVAQEIPFARYETRPAPLQNILWTGNAETEEAFYIGYYSWFDEDRMVSFVRIPKHHERLQPYQGSEHLRSVLRMMKGWYAISEAGEGIVVNDLRFGQIAIPPDPEANFVFAYTVEKQDGRVEIEQRPQQALGDPKQIAVQLWERIWGD